MKIIRFIFPLLFIATSLASCGPSNQDEPIEKHYEIKLSTHAGKSVQIYYNNKASVFWTYEVKESYKDSYSDENINFTIDINDSYNEVTIEGKCVEYNSLIGSYVTKNMSEHYTLTPKISVSITDIK